MRGSKRERRPGVWELRVEMPRDPLTGDRRSSSRTFRGGTRAADKALRQMIAEAESARPDSRADVTVGEVLERWYETRSADWAPMTAHDHRSTIDGWLAPVHRWQLAEVRTADVEAFYAKLKKSGGVDGRPLSATTVRKVHSVLRAALEDACRWEWIDRNPAARARRPKVTQYDAKVPTVADVLAAVELADDAFGAFIRVAIATGARRGELVALQWRDIDLDAGTVNVRRSVTVIGGETIVKSTKTGATAVLALDDGTVDVLRSWRRVRQTQALAAGAGKLRGTDYVWTDDTLQGPWIPDRVTDRWRSLARQVPGLEGVRLHDLRHACATWLIASGVDVRTVAGRLRHASPAMTLDVYASRDLGADRVAADIMGRLLGNQ